MEKRHIIAEFIKGSFHEEQHSKNRKLVERHIRISNFNTEIDNKDSIYDKRINSFLEEITKNQTFNKKLMDLANDKLNHKQLKIFDSPIQAFKQLYNECEEDLQNLCNESSQEHQGLVEEFKGLLKERETTDLSFGDELTEQNFINYANEILDSNRWIVQSEIELIATIFNIEISSYSL